MKIILTGATGFVGEGILLECLKDERVEKLDRIYLLFYPLMRLMNQANPLSEIGRAVINVLENGSDKQILESKDFKKLGKSNSNKG